MTECEYFQDRRPEEYGSMYIQESFGKDCATKEEAQLCFQELRSQGKSLSIVVTGQVGQGKSKLVNSCIGEPQAEECFGSRSVTQNIEKFTKNIGGVEVTLIDTPGFSDPRKTDRDIIGEISKELDEIDLVLFCVRMDRRVQKADYRIMRKLTRAFGKAIWHNVLFVLTFANKVDAETFARTRAEWEDDLREYAHTKGEVPADIVQEIPVVVAGNEEESLPGCESWSSEFWMRAFTRTKDSAKPAYLTLTLGLNKLDLQDSDDGDSLENSLEIGVLGRRELSLQILEEHVGRAREEIKMSGVQCDAKPKTRRRHVTPHSSRRPQQKDITNPNTGITPHHLTQVSHTKSVPDTGATRRQPHTTRVPNTGASRQKSTIVPDTGATLHQPTPVIDNGATRHQPTPVPDAGTTCQKSTPVTNNGATHHRPTPVPDNGATRHRPTPVPDNGATCHQPTPVPDTGATRHRPTLVPDTGATRHRPTPVTDNGVTRHRPTPVTDNGATPCPLYTEMSCLQVLKAVLHALRSLFPWLFCCKKNHTA